VFSLTISRERPSILAALLVTILSSHFKSPILYLSNFMSSRRSLYWLSPFLRVVCSILIFSYSKASSSLRRISCVPRISLSFYTSRYCFFCTSFCLSASFTVCSRDAMHWSAILYLTSKSFICCLCCVSMLFRASISLLFSARSWTPFVHTMSFCSISSLSWEIWWAAILNLRLSSATSSCASNKFLEYRLRSDLTAS